MKEKIVCIEWDDASFNSGYYDKADPERYEQLRTKSVGHLIKSTSKEVIIGTDCWRYSKEPREYRHITTIPRKMINRIMELKGENK